jgi:NTP pyrophosphatase (non-canonical NTP hydrolase)
MQLNAYQNKAYKTKAYPDDLAFEYLGLKLASEAGEVAGKIGKIILKMHRGQLAPDNQTPEAAAAREAVKYELGDVLWYVACLAKEMGVSLKEVAESNLEKLESRKARGTLIGDGDNR